VLDYYLVCPDLLLDEPRQILQAFKKIYISNNIPLFQRKYLSNGFSLTYSALA
jgi:hypothetical protein